MTRFSNLVLFACGVCWASCNNSSQENNSDESFKKPKIATVEEANQHLPKEISGFAVEALIESITAIELSRLALTKASGVETRKFAENTLVDYTFLKKELSELAKRKNIMLPIVMDKEHQKPYEKLKELQVNSQFDERFINLMLTNLENNIELHEDAMKDIRDAEIRSFISKSLPKIRRHEKAAMMLKTPSQTFR